MKSIGNLDSTTWPAMGHSGHCSTTITAHQTSSHVAVDITNDVITIAAITDCIDLDTFYFLII